MSDVEISVIVSARDAEQTIGATLDGLIAQDGAPPYEVIVVDNGSNDATVDVVGHHPLDVRTIRRQRGSGPGAARNEGASRARGALLAFTDADCAPSPAWIAEGARAAAAADLVQGAVAPEPGRAVGPYDRTLVVRREYGLYETANMFVRREWFERVGGFTDWTSFAGEGRRRRTRVPDRPFGEDAWFAWRARRLGARTMFSSAALVHHAVFPGDARSFVREQARLRHFPALVARIPELRDVFTWRRLFLNRRTAAFDVAVLGALAAGALRSPFPLVGSVPYVVLGGREVRRFRLGASRSLGYACAVLWRDTVGFVALVRGSIEARSPLL